MPDVTEGEYPMTAFKILAAAAVAAGVVSHMPAASAQAMVKATPEAVAKVLQDKGYKALIGKDKSGDPKVESAAEGVNFIVYFYGCKNGANCGDIQFSAGFQKTEADANAINEWNKNQRFAKAYLDSDGDAHFETDVHLDDAGMPLELFKTYLDLWTSTLPAFRDTAWPK